MRTIYLAYIARIAIMMAFSVYWLSWRVASENRKRKLPSSGISSKGKGRFYIYESEFRKTAFGQQKKPDRIGLFAGYIFFVPSLWQGQKDSNSLAAALSCRGSEAPLGLHSLPRPEFESPFRLPKVIPPGWVGLLLAGAVRLELTRTVLETAMLPLHHAPELATKGVYHR